MNNCNFPRCVCTNPATCSNGADYFPARPDVAQHVPRSDDTADAFNLGAGRPVVEATEAERRQFEAWMAGHNWKCAPWDGKSYGDVFTRTTWAAWRDRGALAAIDNRRLDANEEALVEPLTDDEIKKMWSEYAPNIGGIFEFARAIEAAHAAKLAKRGEA